MHDRYTVTGAGDRPEVKVRSVIRAGALVIDAGQTISEVIAEAAAALDDACAAEIIGEILFKGSDGRFYAGSVEFVVAEADPEYVAAILAEGEDTPKVCAACGATLGRNEVDGGSSVCNNCDVEPYHN